MAFKINISEKGKTFHLETDSEDLIGKKIGEKLSGKDINGDLSGYEFEIKGTSDKAGLPGKKDVVGLALRKILQINLNVLKKGGKSLEEVFPDQNQKKQKEEKAESAQEKSE